MAGEDALFQRFGKEFRRGDVLFREGEPGKEMYVIQAGKVNITKTVRETEKILATLGAGEFFGEMSILNHKPRSAGAVVAEDAKLLVIDPKTFEAMIRGNVEIAVRLIKKLSDRLQEADEQIENLLFRDPSSRVVHYLWQAALKRGKDTPQGRLLSVNLNELHVRMGVNAPEVQEAVNKTAKAKIISLVPEGVLVPDTGKMKKYLEFLEMKERFGD
ncbi:MAG: Crp/Fnr family transcriptional regulator [Deltaproteobacteria bacterium]|nr:MAG: Crp/Fnr family transcriptional regulator [Deltaproteobacteria bacterium]TMA76385.1 MAG: Crp/Fnr family transcriptional regulator [Deltaproteobacteria bacterium]TMB40134.1 MAG: Crp/Fnr family transcriptional regulator [Deltaproteobacteria bacterium]